MVFNLGVVTPWGPFVIFLGVVRVSDRNIHNYFQILYMEPLFVVSMIIGKLHKNDSLLFQIVLNVIMTITKI